MIGHGKLCFKTCSKQLKVPAPFLCFLASQLYPTLEPNPFHSLQNAFDHWFLMELLSGIGSHSIL